MYHAGNLPEMRMTMTDVFYKHSTIYGCACLERLTKKDKQTDAKDAMLLNLMFI